jgi:hypothetical protein
MESGQASFASILVDYLEMLTSLPIGLSETALDLATSVKNKTTNAYLPKLFPSNLLNTINLDANKTIAFLSKPKQAYAGNKIGRNQIISVRYLDGTIRQGKFKLFSEDIRLGKCEMLKN